MDRDYVVGVDFDSTIVSYDDVMYRVALQRGLIYSDTRKSKRDIRDIIRQIPDGETEWQRLQAVVYGSRMEEARLINGVQTFFELCKLYKVKVYIISHKTEFAKFDETGTNLRAVAMAWMKKNRFFETNGLSLPQENVHFETSRRQKIERVRHLRCTHFIDDLEETFLENSFPKSIEKILYAPHIQRTSLTEVKIFTTWEEISDYFFNATS